MFFYVVIGLLILLDVYYDFFINGYRNWGWEKFLDFKVKLFIELYMMFFNICDSWVIYFVIFGNLMGFIVLELKDFL